ncbi:MAG: amidohydrolase family protein [Anaerovibrio sp.]|uniref:amidohydrolase family protein n=1 Tax=Anaerovibrio sp. TaxID=1872532 RepID=UPI0025CFF71E|nr:amidohydrolase family protein [Anaerovibrio sp.]MCR5176232.1 amidohydrolase family protein [Anaerovibrio sp.]
MLDAVCPDKIVFCESSDGHSMWLNTKPMEAYGINRDAVTKWGEECVKVDDKGNPTGFISEAPTFHVRSQLKYEVEDLKAALLSWQDFALSMGYTGVYSAGVNILNPSEPIAIHEVAAEGKLRHYIYGGIYLKDNTDTPEKDMEMIAADAEKNNSKHYHITGAKVFCDGVVESHTAWLLDDYADQAGYKGVSEFDDHEKMVRLLKAASKHDLNVHVHSIGDAASRAWIDAIAEAEETTGNFGMRNVLAHLHVVNKEDIKRIADYNIMAVAGMMWMQKEPDVFTQEVQYLGEEKAYSAYPVKCKALGRMIIKLDNLTYKNLLLSIQFSCPDNIIYLGDCFFLFYVG